MTLFDFDKQRKLLTCLSNKNARAQSLVKSSWRQGPNQGLPYNMDGGKVLGSPMTDPAWSSEKFLGVTFHGISELVIK